MMLPILYEDQDILVFNKLPGWVVNDALTVAESTLTVQSWFQKYLVDSNAGWPQDWAKLVPADFDTEYGTPEEIFADRLGMVHRLDKETSGALIMAKHPGSLVALLKQFREREVEKTYLCLVHGLFKVPRDVIELPLARSRQDRQKFATDPDGRPAVTEYEVQKSFTQLDLEVVQRDFPEQIKGTQLFKKSSLYQGFSLVKCWPKTGRTHQIRVHMQALRHPIVGDDKYVGKKRAKLDHVWCPRQFLHAESLKITHPRTDEKLMFEAPLTADLQAVLQRVK